MLSERQVTGIMEKQKAKEKGKYVDKLDGEPKGRYLQKLEQINGSDSYEAVSKLWSTDPSLLLSLSYPDTVNYLVLGCSAYTLQDFKSYKSLEAHMQFTTGWVQEMKVFVPNNCDNVVVLTKVSSTLFLILMVTPAWAMFWHKCRRKNGESA